MVAKTENRLGIPQLLRLRVRRLGEYVRGGRVDAMRRLIGGR